MKAISVVGLGKLGEPLAICLASRGFQVLGVDLNNDIVRSLNGGVSVTQEPGLQEMLTKHFVRFSATTDIRAAVSETDATFFMVNTPSDDQGRFSNRFLTDALRETALAVKEQGKDYHLFIIGSTLMPGSCKNEILPLLNSHLEPKQFGLCYCPELVALGNCVNGFLRPDIIIIGADDQDAHDKADAIYDGLCPESPSLYRFLSLAEAEITKVTLNFYLTLKISFANTLAAICERYPGVNVDAITRALGCDSRISPKFLRGGLAFGGFCFPRDVGAFDALCRDGEPLPTLLPWAVDEVNKEQNRRLARKVVGFGKDAIAVLGLSFKPGTPEMEESPAKWLVYHLFKFGINVTVYDPLAMDNARAMWGDKVRYARDMMWAAGSSPVVVIATAWNGWKALRPSDFQEGAIVLDCWRVLHDDVRNSDRIEYHAIGVGR